MPTSMFLWIVCLSFHTLTLSGNAEKTGKNANDLPSLLDNSAEEEETLLTSMLLWIVCLSIYILTLSGNAEKTGKNADDLTLPKTSV